MTGCLFRLRARRRQDGPHDAGIEGVFITYDEALAPEIDAA